VLAFFQVLIGVGPVIAVEASIFGREPAGWLESVPAFRGLRGSFKS